MMRYDNVFIIFIKNGGLISRFKMLEFCGF